MSAAARARIPAAQRARWAKVKRQSSNNPPIRGSRSSIINGKSNDMGYVVYRGG